MMDSENSIDASTILDNSHTLTDLLESNENDSIFENNEPLLMQNSPYYNDNSFIKTLQDYNDNFSLMSLNCQSLPAKFDILKCYLENYKKNNCVLSTLCLQETWLNENSDLSSLQINGYNLISKEKSCSAHGGVAFYLHNSLNYNIINTDFQTFDSVCVEIDLKTDRSTPSNKLIVCNIYRPPRTLINDIESFMTDINMLFDQLARYKHVVITGDFNLDLLKYQENHNTNDFLNLILSNSYIPKITLPTRLTHRQGTLIDNFLVKISDDYSQTYSGIILNNISDHLPYFTILAYLKYKKKPDKYIKVNNVTVSNMQNFKEDLSSQEISNCFSNILENDPNASYEKFNNIISTLMAKHFPIKIMKFNKYKHKKTKWITSGILKSISQKDKMYHRLASICQDDPQFFVLKSNFQMYNKILKQSIRKAKKIYYENCFNKYKSDIKKTWTSINDIINRCKTKTDFPEYFLFDGHPHSDKTFIANKFNSYYTNIGLELASNINLPENKSFKDYLKNPTIQKFDFLKTTENEIIKVIDKFKSKSSTGYDRVSNNLIKFVKKEICTPIMLIFNQTISTGMFPNALKIAKVSMLFKKGDAKLIENYRPISILPSFSKIFEKIMFQQMYNYFSSFKLFYNSQYGFRSLHSTELAAYELIERILKDLDNDKIPLNIYLDLSKAFDTLDHQILLSKLSYYGFYDSSLKLMNSYLTDRQQFVDFNGTQSDYCQIKTGVPQGSILGPLLFIIYMNDIYLSSTFFHPLIYADDTTLFVSINTSEISTISNTINNELENVNTWLKLNKLSLNTSKTKAILFHMPQKQITQLPNIKIDNYPIVFEDSFNFLGIVLDKNLRWTPHIDLISKKISKINGILNRIKNFLPTYVLVIIYNTLVLPYLNYGTFVWGWKNRQINILQKKSIRIISKSSYNAHTSLLFKNLRILKFGDLCALHDLKLCFQIENGQSPAFFSQFHSSSQNYITNTIITRTSSNIRLPRIYHEFSRKSIAYRYPNILNNMADNIKSKIYTHSWNGLKLYFKNMTISSYDTSCHIENCYICNR